ncbi:GNAT family N-acetyltransferase [Pediococcus inopinatus]|uniref:GNAT family N-acetyltransferase n=1 Tax=Pediococcus inopinatus TaxID=114090 RepID=A0ABZ0Q547_9LACO|nr:GNAT family N-acetyltransferase [Pediococcus inopinatus]WPC16954.1 GNAT family N-acetyltransferase [Pediococcus inopinatus]WPC19927.1 GNAT family N-acetyltransferase [Pediococcus inopinatus]WPC21627.1 GNAT family N-acetyltransferase [Pediococcus inopinatus]WPP09441.1 GNAT family N-acetyltransferase [Pediococcus inopinatus]
MTEKGKLKRIGVKDWQQLQQISIETYTDTFGPYNPPEIMDDFLTTAYESKKLQRELANPDSRFYFIELNDEVAGYLKLNVNDAQSEKMGPDSLEVERIYIRPAFKHQGLGTYLIQVAEKLAAENHKAKIWLGVWEHNEPAKQFYEKLGFKRIGQHSFFMGDDEQTDFLMQKVL